MNFPSSMKRETLFVREGRKKLFLTNFRIIINKYSLSDFSLSMKYCNTNCVALQNFDFSLETIASVQKCFFFFYPRIFRIHRYHVTIYIYKFWIFFDYSTNLKENFYSNSIRYTVTNKTGFKLFVTFVLLLISTNKIESNFKLYFFLSLSLSSI